MGIFEWKKKLVSLLVVGAFCVIAAGARAFADDDGKGQPPAKPAPTTKIDAPAPLTERERQLLDRVEQLEKRMAELEDKAQPSAAVPAYGHVVMFRTELPHASRVVTPTSSSMRIAGSTSWSFTK